MSTEATTHTFVVPGISCAHCVTAITSEVGALAGVHDVAVDLDGKVVTVIAEAVGRDAIVAAIDEAGYEVAEP